MKTTGRKQPPNCYGDAKDLSLAAKELSQSGNTLDKETLAPWWQRHSQVKAALLQKGPVLSGRPDQRCVLRTSFCVLKRCDHAYGSDFAGGDNGKHYQLVALRRVAFRFSESRQDAAIRAFVHFFEQQRQICSAFGGKDIQQWTGGFSQIVCVNQFWRRVIEE